jgi:2-O-methyltransferase
MTDSGVFGETVPSIQHFIPTIFHPGVLDPVVIELGACHGEDTQWLSRLGQCISVEPDPRNAADVRERNLPITFYQAAIGSENTTGILWMSGGQNPYGQLHTASSSIHRPTGHIIRHPGYTFDEKVEVQVITLDRIKNLEELDHVTFIWADIQGAEGDMVRGGQETLRVTDWLYCEYSNEELYEGQPVLDEWVSWLPATWRMVYRWESDVLLRNVRPRVEPSPLRG